MASAEESDANCQNLPRESQLTAWASVQSHGRKVDGANVKLSFQIGRHGWTGGEATVVMGFWQQRPQKMHDRPYYQWGDGGMMGLGG